MERARNCRPDRLNRDLLPVRRRGNRTGRLTLRGGGLVLVASLSAGCSLSFPIAGFKADDAPTGTIERSAAMLSPALDREDWRRAKAALSVALDPQGNGGGVNWLNPQSGAKGSFVALAPPFLDQDRICRTFDAEVSTAPRSGRRLSGSACRQGDGGWELRDARDAKA